MVELCVALTVLAVGVVGVVGVMNSTFGIAVGNNHRSKAVALATRELEALRSTPWDQLAPSADAQPREVQVGGTTYEVARAVTTAPDGQKEATVVVSWDNGGGRVSDVHQSTKIYPGGIAAATATTVPSNLSGLLAAPTALLATVPTTVDGGTTVDLVWTNPVPANPTGSHLVVEWSVAGSDGSWHRLNEEIASTVSSIRVPGLSAGTTYNFRMAASSAAGTLSSWSPVATVTTGSATSTTCAYGSAEVSPSRVRRHVHHLHKLAQPVTVSIHTSGSCLGLHVVYQPNDLATPRSVPLVPLAGGVWKATLPEVVGLQWGVGVRPITFHDQLETKHATAYLTVCDHGASSC
jgi:hypothetical protein